MSWLLLDVGNTAVKWAHSDAQGNRFVGTGIELRMNTQPLAQRLSTAWRVPRAKRAFGCSVADQATMEAIEQAAREAAGIPVTWLKAQPHFAGSGPGYGLALINAYRVPEQLGADRWHAMIAACAKFPGDSLVIASSGTATTIECIRREPNAASVFVGGVIAPGVDLMHESLARGTARLPDVRYVVDGHVVEHPDNTDDAIVTGVFHAQAGMIERVVREFGEELARDGRPAPRLLLAGGRARSLLGALERRLRGVEPIVCAVTIEDNLVLRGVALRAHAEIVAADSTQDVR
ncbi:MAG TPA: type III pantothenate kinase [Burkholderiaceae bacterium]|nr:type III pantothenate kinase [Burkholderiaceae bacterium]